MGDFNAILFPYEKKNIHVSGKKCNLFTNFVKSCNLQDLDFVGQSFTWQWVGTSDRLDWEFASDSWIFAFPQCLVSHLPHINFDHMPFLLKTKSILSLPFGRPFRFITGWTEHVNFPSFLRDKWKFSGNKAQSLSDFTSNVKDWNQYVYGFIGAHKRKLMKELSNVQKALDRFTSDRLVQTEANIWDELKKVLDHEDFLWRQKSRWK